MIQPDAQGLYHPKDNDQIIELVEYAKRNHLQVRVQGAAQSETSSVFTDGFDQPGSKNINIELDQLRRLELIAPLTVVAGAGWNLGFNPFDPAGVSSEDDSNNLLRVLDKKWSLSIQNVPDAIHQTVGGFISTGSSAGTMQHSFDECILSVTIIDGTGALKVFNRSGNPQDDFFGVVVSMGLMGIITEVTLQCTPAFNIIGQEAVTAVSDCEFDFFGPDGGEKLSLKEFLTKTEFCRILWWPIKSLQRAIVWQSRIMEPHDHKERTGRIRPQPYQPLFPKWFGLDTTFPSEFVAAKSFELIATWPNWLHDILGNDPEIFALEKGIRAIFPSIYPLLSDKYFPVNSPERPAQEFWSGWLDSLPMDKVEFSNNLFDLTYTEIWVAAGEATKTIRLLDEHYKRHGCSATGFYTVEVRAAPKSEFWLSPAYQQDSIRFNIMYFNKSIVKAEIYFAQFWHLLYNNQIDFRLHWGKKLPSPESETGATYLKAQYPQWTVFMDLRRKMDPHNIFLNNYWKAHLGI